MSLRARKPVRPRPPPKRIPPCKVIVPLQEAESLDFREAVGLAAVHTKETGLETGFNYELSGHPISPIYQGTANCIYEPGGGSWHGGQFHTHPHRDMCVFSPADFTVASRSRADEMSVACPDANTLVLQSGPGALQEDKRKLVESLAKNASETEDRWQQAERASRELLGIRKYDRPGETQFSYLVGGLQDLFMSGFMWNLRQAMREAGARNFVLSEYVPKPYAEKLRPSGVPTPLPSSVPVKSTWPNVPEKLKW